MPGIKVLRLSHFLDLTGLHNPGVKSVIARHTIPQDSAYVLMEAHSLEIVIPTAQEFPVPNDAAEEMTVELTQPFAFDDCPLPYRRKFAWEVYDSQGNLVLRAGENEVNIQQAKRQVTGPKPANADGLTLRVIYLPRNGIAFIDKVDTAGAQRREKTVYEENIVLLHTTDQYRRGSVPRIDRSHLILQDQSIELAVLTDWRPHLQNDIATLIVRYQHEEMGTVLERARRDSGNPTLTLAQLRAGYVASWS